MLRDHVMSDHGSTSRLGKNILYIKEKETILSPNQFVPVEVDPFLLWSSSARVSFSSKFLPKWAYFSD